MAWHWTSTWLKEPSTYIAIISSLLALSSISVGLLWISTLPLLAQVPIGAAAGMAAMAALYSLQSDRSDDRRRKAVNLAQLAFADIVALRSILPDKNLPSWMLDHYQFEKVRWINAVLEDIWPFFSEAVSGGLKLQLQSTLDEYKVGIIQQLSVKTLSLGSDSPVIAGIKMREGGQDEAMLEVQIDWRQNQNQEMVLQLQTTGPDFTVQVKDFVVYAVLSITFKPLKEELPGFGAVVLSLLEPPLIDFQTKFLSGDVKALPGVRKVVDNMLITALMDLLVSPSRRVIPIMPGDYSDLENKTRGHLHVELVEAKDLANKDSTGKSDPFFVLHIRQRRDCIKESTRKRDTFSPIWNEKFIFNVEDQDVQTLTIRLMDADTVSLVDYIGYAELSISQFEANIQKDIWIDLVGDPKRRQRCSGSVHLLVEYVNCTEGKNDKEISMSGSQEDALSAKSLTDTGTNESKEYEGIRLDNEVIVTPAGEDISVSCVEERRKLVDGAKAVGSSQVCAQLELDHNEFEEKGEGTEKAEDRVESKELAETMHDSEAMVKNSTAAAGDMSHDISLSSIEGPAESVDVAEDVNLSQVSAPSELDQSNELEERVEELSFGEREEKVGDRVNGSSNEQNNDLMEEDKFASEIYEVD